MEKKLSFQINGEYVCTIARTWFWDEDRPFDVCERLLLGCLITERLTLEERKGIVIEILEGRKKLIGTNTFELVEDGRDIRPLSMKLQQYERESMIRRIQADMESRPLAYVDRFAAPRPLEDYEEIRHWQHGEGPELGTVMSQPDLVRMYLYSQTNWIGAARLEPGFYDAEQPLDRGLYLLGHPNWIYDFIGAPLSEDNETLLYQKLYDFWEARLQEDLSVGQLAFIWTRNERYQAFLRAEGASPPAPAEQLSMDERDALLQIAEPDDFLSEYGMIDRQGKWFSCPFGGHNAKAHTLARAKPEQFGYQPGERIPHRDRALDLLFDAGWVILQNPYISGHPAVEFKIGLRPSKAQVETVFDYMTHFGRHTLSGIDKIFDI